MRLIDADAFYKDICDSLNEMTRIGIAVDGEWLWGKLNDSLDNAPTIEPEPYRECDKCTDCVGECQEEKNALHVGDEVEFIGSNPNYKVKVNEVMTGYVIGFVDGLSDECSVRILTKKHGTYLRSREMCEKTGKHNPDVEKVMASFEEEKGD